MILPPLISVAFITLLERKVLRIVGFRLGPNKVSFLGLLQPIGDALKLANKRINFLRRFSLFFYYISAFFIISISLSLFVCLNVVPNFFLLKFSFLIFLIILAFNSLNSIYSGWSSYRKYSLIGSIRTVAQLISYEAVLYLCLFFFFILYNSFDVRLISFYGLSFTFIFIIPCFFIWFPTMLSELNRTPYDFSEGERELVRGFNTEFASGCFTLIFLAEYGRIIFFSMISSFFFFYPVYISFFFFFFFII
jgi:NADH-ubiquinone oxidoreductase chain 1